MQESEQPDVITVIYNWTLETAPAITGDNVSENATTIQNEEEQSNCTKLSRLDLMEVFARTDIGNTEIWGSMSEAWLACFIVYYAVFSILLVITVCSYAYYLRRVRFLDVWIIIVLFTAWFSFSFVHHVLLMISIVNGSSVQLANATRALEIIASSSFMNFAIVTILSIDPKSYSSQLQRYVTFFIIPTIYTIAGANIAVSFLAGSSALIALLVFRLSFLVANILSVNLNINYKRYFKSKEWFYWLWTQKFKKMSIYPYFFISCAYFFYVLIITNHNCCIDEIELHRGVWLVFNALLKIYAFGFSMVYLVKIRAMFCSSSTESEGKGCLRNWIKSHTFRQKHKPPLRSSSFTYQPSLAESNIHCNFSSATQLTDLKTDQDTPSNLLCESDAVVIKEQAVQVAICVDPMKNLENCTIEIESLHQNQNPHYSSLDIDMHMFSNPVVTCSLNADISHNVKTRSYSDESLNIATESSIINEGKIIQVATYIVYQTTSSISKSLLNDHISASLAIYVVSINVYMIMYTHSYDIFMKYRYMYLYTLNVT